MISCRPCLVDAQQFQDLAPLLAQWKAARPSMGVLVLLAEANQSSIPALQKAFRQAGLPMVGAVFPALVTDQGFASTGAWLLCFDEMPPWFLVEDLNGGAESAAGRIAALLPETGGVVAAEASTELLFLIFDGLIPNIASILDGLWVKARNGVRYCGVNAGSETFQPMPCLFDCTRNVGNGVIGLRLPAAARAVVRHGYPVAATVMHATSSEGNRIDRIDYRPAMEVYREVILAEYGVTLTNENFYDYAVHYPFGVVALLDVLVRIPVGFSEDGAIFCVGEIPPNSALRLLRAPAAEDRGCVEMLVEAVWTKEEERGVPPLLTFYCAGRRMHFGEAAALELSMLKTRTGAGGVAGALTLGEIDTHSDLGIPRFHNASVVCLPGLACSTCGTA
ncbi:MAG: FIST N-terminal domain-containing protein [Rhodocyclaceae bacterium]|jgi:hypothetical protein|nr:FIST N-terminal domain-containing protein [Rhodocyclaceae bacterium]